MPLFKIDKKSVPLVEVKREGTHHKRSDVELRLRCRMGQAHNTLWGGWGTGGRGCC